jgi:REP element-mobilizing transposase RayT
MVRASLERACERHHFALEAYCFMPDHLHVLVSGSEESRLKSFVHLFKQLYAAKKELGVPIWQISYYDHIVRREEDLEAVANYIWANPVQAGLVDDLRDYAYSGPRPVLEALGRPEGLQLQALHRD